MGVIPFRPAVLAVKVRFAAQNRRALDRSGQPDEIHPIGGKGDKQKGS